MDRRKNRGSLWSIQKMADPENLSRYQVGDFVVIKGKQVLGDYQDMIEAFQDMAEKGPMAILLIEWYFLSLI